ncbi:unnamed protein product [Effrenium voratum]|nr:unnamed protein product [Effrenium voratum]
MRRSRIRQLLKLRSTHWVATSGQFLRLPGKVARPWLTQQQEDTDAKIAEGRARLKALLQALVSEHPQVTDLPLGVCDLLLEQRQTQEQFTRPTRVRAQRAWHETCWTIPALTTLAPLTRRTRASTRKSLAACGRTRETEKK